MQLDKHSALQVYQALVGQDPQFINQLACIALHEMAASMTLEPNQPAPGTNDVIEYTAGFNKDMFKDFAEAMHQRMTVMRENITVTAQVQLTWKDQP